MLLSIAYFPAVNGKDGKRARSLLSSTREATASWSAHTAFRSGQYRCARRRGAPGFGGSSSATVQWPGEVVERSLSSPGITATALARVNAASSAIEMPRNCASDSAIRATSAGSLRACGNAGD